MSKEKSPFEILFPYITILGIGLGIPAINALRSVKGDFFEMRNIFGDSRLPETIAEPKKLESNSITPTIDQFRTLRDLENFNR
jgi:hypothetical protein